MPQHPLLTPLTTQEQEQLRDWRRHLHAEPELSLAEYDTQAYLRQALQSMGVQRVIDCGGTGLVLRLGGKRPGKTLLLRADMDALPVQEQADVAFASRRPGLMHACGHDAHMACMLATVQRLLKFEAELPGQVVVALQPGEECGRGAVAMIEQGLVDGRWDGGSAVEAAIGLHVWSPLPVGTISCASGPVMAAVDDFTITVHGKGGHGALPHTAIDSVVVASEIVLGLQTLASRRSDPLKPVVVTVGSIHGGSAFNVIAEEVILHGTVRSYDTELGRQLPLWMGQLVEHTAAAHGATAELSYRRYTTALHNNAGIADLVAGAAAKVDGIGAIDRQLRMMAGEDMAYLLQAVPGCFFFVGCGGPEAQPHHCPRFVVNEAALPLGVGVLLQATWDFLQG